LTDLPSAGILKPQKGGVCYEKVPAVERSHGCPRAFRSNLHWNPGGSSHPVPPKEDFSNDIAYSVLRVIDGDTVEIEYEGRPTTVRLIGVDTPETVHPQRAVEAFGKEAFAFTRNLLLGEEVWLRFDTNKVDKYGRLLAYLYRVPDGLFVNLEIVRQGYGHVYTGFPFRHMDLFKYYEARARDIGKGLWEAAKAGKAEEQPSGQSQSDIVYITKTGTKYHRAGCRYLSLSAIPISREEAIRRGYTPCSVCKP
jgi:micrococcal nuclease